MRTIHPDTLAALKSAVVPTRISMVRLDFDYGTIAYHSGGGDLVFDGHTYTGLGDLGSISQLRESGGAKSSSISIVISGISPSVVSIMQEHPFINRKAYIRGALVGDDGAIIGEPLLLFSGSMDGVNAEIGTTATFTIQIKSRLADWERPRKLLYTDADQQKLHPGDKGFEYVAQLSQRKIIWPRAEFQLDPRD